MNILTNEYICQWIFEYPNICYALLCSVISIHVDFFLVFLTYNLWTRIYFKNRRTFSDSFQIFFTNGYLNKAWLLCVAFRVSKHYSWSFQIRILQSSLNIPSRGAFILFLNYVFFTGIVEHGKFFMNKNVIASSRQNKYHDTW